MYLSVGGVDMIYDLVGGDYAEPALRAIARHGKYLVIGFTAGIPKMPLNLTLLKECQIVGVFWGQLECFNLWIDLIRYLIMIKKHLL